MRKKRRLKSVKKNLKINKIDFTYFNKCLSYDSKTGLFVWKHRPENHFKNKNAFKSWNARFPNKVAGSLNKKTGYISIKIDRKLYRANRLAWLAHYGYMPENDIDHKDRVKHHNWISNLREVSRVCNSRNCNISKNNTSGVSGVMKHRRSRKWFAQIKINYRHKFLGYFENFDDAVMARWEAEKFYKFPDCNTYSSAYNHLKDKGLI